jgi:hypothetical protein
VLFADALSPWYDAVIACAPTARLDFDSVVTPLLKVVDPIPIVLSLKITLPVGFHCFYFTVCAKDAKPPPIFAEPS